ncbi:hypothetical protein CRYUN_Cryun33cG0056400 [Craigia yunnanensis]
MAGGGFRDRGNLRRAHLYEYKITKYFVFTCLVAAMGGSFLDMILVFLAVPLYLSEMAPAKIPGAVNQMFQLTTCVGILVANAINYGTEKIHPWGWRLSLGLATVLATLMFVGGGGGWLVLPETPNSLVEQGRLEEAKRVLVKVRGTTNVDAEFADLVEASDAARPASLISSLITGGALVLAPLISMALVDKFGRRAFFMEAGMEMFDCMVLGSFGWPVPSELFPLETRSAGQSMVVYVNLLFTALISQCFLVSLCHLKYGIFLLFAGLIVIMSSFIYFLLPETKQVPIEEVYLL